MNVHTLQTLESIAYRFSYEITSAPPLKWMGEEKRRTFTLEFKLQVIQWITVDEGRNAYYASKHFQLNPKTVRNWVHAQEELQEKSHADAQNNNRGQP